MPVLSGPSPKRRRTDTGQVSADSIAQANSTLQHFTGQRQNRWMHGYIPHNAHEDHVRTSPKQTPATSTGAVSQPALVRPSDVAGTKNNPRPPQQTNSTAVNIVQYESPYANQPIDMAAAVVIDNPRKSIEKMAREAPPGLPSPVSSDGVINSTALPQTESGPRRIPSTPRTSFVSTTAGSPSGPGNGSPIVGPHRRRPSQPQMTQRQASIGRPPDINNAVGYEVASAQQRGAPILPSQPSVQQPQHHGLDLAVMLHRLEQFEQDVFPKLPFNTVDRGRLTLLRDAIDKGDIFYIALSQIHSLTSSPQRLPQPAQHLGRRSLELLDVLFCPNTALSGPVLKWLAAFPAHISYMYSLPLAGFYDHYVRGVVSFLERLPFHWDIVVGECKKRAAPPLMEDLTDRLGMPSPVLQTTAFRAIARMICDVGTVIETVESLHSLDQAGHMRGRRRSDKERKVACLAFLQTIQARKQYDQQLTHQLMLLQRGQLQPGVSMPSFVIPESATVAFRVPAPPAVAYQQVQVAQHHQSIHPAQQQQAMLANAQALSRMRRASMGGSGSPVVVGTAQQPGPGTIVNIVVTMPQQQRPPGKNLVYPHETEQPRAQPTEPDLNRSALHQVHLRSPRLITKSKTQEAPRMYRFVSMFAMSPRPIGKDLTFEVIPFQIAQQFIDRAPLTGHSPSPGGAPLRIIDESSLTFRLRCAAITPRGFPTEGVWIEAECIWPDNLYLQCNGQFLEPRRKLQHGRYLPIDLTEFVKPGENQLTVIVNRMSTDTRPFNFALAVEIVGAVAHESIQTGLKRISAPASSAAIKKSLSGGDDNDDEVAVMSSNLTINLFDPFSHAKMFDLPVRGSACLHRDCFDFETFLQQRKRPIAGAPTTVDCWRCPICRGDVRPHTLVVDEFLVEVRKELERNKLLNTRSILVEPDGSWKPKAEERTGVRSPSLEREERKAKARSSTPATKKPAVVEIIELD